MARKRILRYSIIVVLTSLFIACIPAVAFADAIETNNTNNAALDRQATEDNEFAALTNGIDLEENGSQLSDASEPDVPASPGLNASETATEADETNELDPDKANKQIDNVVFINAAAETESDVKSSPDDTLSETDKLAASYRGTLEEGKTYFFNFNVCPTAVLDICGASQGDGGNAQIYAYNATSAQQWMVTHDDNGYLTLTAAHSGKVLDVKGALAQNGTNVWQYASNGTFAQKWIAIPAGNGLVELHSALDFHYVLDVAGASSANGANVQIFISNGTNAQRLRPLCANPDVAPCIDLGLDGWYAISASGNTSFVLDVAGASTSNGANVQIYQSNATLAQFFRFEYDNGYYFIVNARSEKALDVDSGNIMPGTNIQQWTFNKTNKNQMFSIVYNDDGTYSFINKKTGLSVDINAARLANATNIQGYTGNGTAAQRFVLTKVADLITSGIKEVSFANATGQRLDVAGANWTAGTNVQTYTDNGTLAQKWYVSKIANKDNVFSIESVVAGGMLAEDPNGNICIRTPTGQAAQQWQASINNGGITLTNLETGHALSVANSFPSDFTNVAGSGTRASLLFNDTAPMPNGYFIIKVRDSMSHVIDLQGASTGNGTAIQLYTRNDTGAQRWKITRNNDGSYQIVSGLSAKAMDAKDGVMSNGTIIQQWDYGTNNSNQKWFVEYMPGEGYRIAPYREPSYSVAALGNSVSNSTRMVLATNANQITQRFSFEPTTAPMSIAEQAMFDKAQGYWSSTDWLILVNCSTNRVGIYYGSQYNWQEQYYWECCTGAPSSPTVLGDYTVGIRGYSFDGHGYTCYYYTQFWGDYLFHSQVYDQGTFNIQDGSMGVNVSQGCVRLYLNRAKWIYDNIPSNTHVVTYRE